jgi:hypothetical protein
MQNLLNEVDGEIIFEDGKAVYKVENEEDNYNITIKINQELFLKDVEKYTYKLWDMSLMLSEGDRENEYEDLYFDLTDEEFLNFS